MNDSQRRLARSLAARTATNERTERTAQVVSIAGLSAKVRLSGIVLDDAIPFDSNLNITPNSFVRITAEENIARITARL